MAKKQKIGQYRHRPGAEMAPGPDGRLRPTRARRRFPYRGQVVLAYGVVGAALCAGISWLLQVTGNSRLLPEHLSDQAVPPAPSIDNLFFGAGLPEVVLAFALAGWLIWRPLWNTRPPSDEVGKQPAQSFRLLLNPALGWGFTVGLLMLFVLMYGLCVRGMPVQIPIPMRLLFAVPGMITLFFSALITGVVPLTMILLGLLLGVLTAASVAFLWPHFPEEPILD